MILLLSNERDVTCDLVVLELHRQRRAFVRLNTEQFLAQARITWRFDSSGNPDMTITWRGQEVDVGHFTAIWYRRPHTPRYTAAQNDPEMGTFLEQEAGSYLRNLYELLTGFWVSEPQAIHRAEQKLLQLEQAAALGLTIPSTLVTNRPEEARAFANSHQQIIAKPISGSVVRGAAVPQPIFTNLVTVKDLERLEAVAMGPVLFQERIPNQVDLRVTVVGMECFASEIHSGDGSELDWRRTTSRATYRPHSLPSGLKDQIRALVKSFRLQFSALDFIVTPAGEYVFLELNPNGQWAWLEQRTGTPISRAIVNLLAGTRPAL